MSRNVMAMTVLAHDLERVVKDFGDEVALDLLDELVIATPKRTGRARAGWRVSTSGSVAPPQPPYRRMSRSEGRSALKGRAAGQDATLGNAVPYIKKVHARRPFIPQAMARAGAKRR